MQQLFAVAVVAAAAICKQVIVLKTKEVYLIEI